MKPLSDNVLNDAATTRRSEASPPSPPFAERKNRCQKTESLSKNRILANKTMSNNKTCTYLLVPLPVPLLLP